MAVYKIFPEKDTFIFSDGLTYNAGKDEIVELNSYNDVFNQSQISRILVKFNQQQIENVINNSIGTGSFNATIDYYLAETYGVPVEFTIKSYPVYINGNTEWDNGVGKYGDVPPNTSGVSWQYIQANQTNQWADPFPQFTTGSYPENKQGGGTWYTSSNGQNVESEQSFSLNQDLDLSIDVSTAIEQFYSGTLDNKGFIIKLQDQLETSGDNNIRLKYFGVDTNTIYPPSLTLKWDDSIYQVGDLQTLNTDVATIDIKNNKGTYVDQGKQRFRLTTRPTYPERRFTTASVYLDQYALPENSYWGLKDENTEEMVIPFDTQFTKISCDQQGPFFDIYMDGLQPERYYRLLIKTQLDGSTTVINNQNVFKVVRNG